MRIADRVVSFGSVCFRGYYPDTPHKANQDSFAIVTPEAFGDPKKVFRVRCREFECEFLVPLFSFPTV